MDTPSPDMLRAMHRGHYYCEDSWYSCPLAEDGCADKRETECNCGAPEYNAKLDAAADAWKLDKLAIVGLTHDADRLAEDVRFLRKRLDDAESEIVLLRADLLSARERLEAAEKWRGIAAAMAEMDPWIAEQCDYYDTLAGKE